MPRLFGVIRLRLWAFFLVAVGTIGTVVKDRFEARDSLVLQVFLAVTVALGLVLWVCSKVLEKRANGSTDNDTQ